ncbi:PhzF family phenazine biosynthesis protein [Jannaschia sp. Os4]|uniref:PhzF family phenazine biosynthesis protein n=1 Tax=Jannaschia sp. Os4 TaxID=2807617 RepID=UPI001939D608|nr:PhzF family phenazine biosynthesis isomerase [Jannaschia sp. Os4]MBM2574769.1 PhzF family phenazine biosynthesis protein [Jannaschia sp. Os4]
MTQITEFAAFSDGPTGGNPAGVLVAPVLLPRGEMQSTARRLGHSETVFAAPDGEGWTVRYFAPEAEVAFCGHATIALGARLGELHGPGTYALSLRDGAITVETRAEGDLWAATLVSPPTRSAPLEAGETKALLDLFALAADDLDPRIPPSRAHGGVDHAVLALRDCARLAAMAYDFAAGRDLMRRMDVVTVSLIRADGPARFDARNAFAAGSVVEDPATGAAAAALGGLLVDLGWPGLVEGGTFDVAQGEDMGMPSRLRVEVTGTSGASVRVSGTARRL